VTGDAANVALVAGVVILLVFVVGPILSYNRFVSQRTSIDASWAGIEVELQRRHDLVPNLVETVRGYAAHERAVLTAVTEARARAVAAVEPDVPIDEQARAEDGLTANLTQLLAVSEDYPELKSDRLFRDLHRQLVETEDRIAASRRLFNIEVAAYERRRGSVPSNIVAGIFSFEPRQMFEILDAAAVHRPAVAL
jgi:LemA protein